MEMCGWLSMSGGLKIRFESLEWADAISAVIDGIIDQMRSD